MSKAGKVLIGAAAIAGGAYYYDQNIHPIFPSQKQVKKDLDKLDNKQQEYSNKFSDKIDTAKSKILKTPSITEQVKESNLYQKVANVVDTSSDDAQRKVNEAFSNDKNFLLKAADHYIDSVNKLANGKQYNDITGKIDSAATDARVRAEEEKSAWGGWFSSKKQEVDSKAKELEKDAKAKKNEWFSWGEKKADEVQDKAEKEKSSWTKWGQKKSDEAQKEIDAASKDAEKKKNEWLSWGSSKKEEAQKNAESVANDAEAKKNEWTSWGKKKGDEIKDQAQAASKDAENKKNEWVSWGSSKKDEAKKNLDSALSDAEAKKNEWVNWGLKEAEEAQNSIKKGYNTVVSESDKQIKKFDAQVNSAYQEGKERAILSYESAKKSLDDLLGYAEPDKEAKLKQAKVDFNNSLANLRSYGEDVVGETNDKILKTLGRK